MRLPVLYTQPTVTVAILLWNHGSLIVVLRARNKIMMHKICEEIANMCLNEQWDLQLLEEEYTPRSRDIILIPAGYFVGLASHFFPKVVQRIPKTYFQPDSGRLGIFSVKITSR